MPTKSSGLSPVREVVLEDPFGNSAILHEAAEVRPLSDAEVRGLKTGVFTLELRPGGPRARASP